MAWFGGIWEGRVEESEVGFTYWRILGKIGDASIC